MIDWTKYFHLLVSVDPAAHTCVVEPGIVLDDLNARLAEHGLMFGPEPATHDHCTLGGMIGNNSCGSTAQAAAAVPDILGRSAVTPLLVEAMDEETTGLMRREGAHTASPEELPGGSAWLLVRFGAAPPRRPRTRRRTRHARAGRRVQLAHADRPGGQGGTGHG